jgi:hypothetical protein
VKINAVSFRLFYGEQKLKGGIFEIIFAKTQDAKNHLRQQKKRLLSSHCPFFFKVLCTITEKQCEDLGMSSVHIPKLLRKLQLLLKHDEENGWCLSN